MTILIIEDDVGINELLQAGLEANGYCAACITNAKDALSYLEDHSPYLMILDYSLPDMNGSQFLDSLKAMGKPVPPFIVSTGHGNENIAVNMMKLGARDYVVKDSSFLDLLPEVVKKVDKQIENETKRKQAEAALQASEEKYRNLFESLYDVHYCMDETGSIALISSSVETRFGYAPNELTGTSMADFYADQRVWEEFQRLIKRHAYVNNFEARFKHKDNSDVWVSVNGKLRTDSESNFTVIEGAIRDITQQRQTENDIQALVESTVGITGDVFFKKTVEKLCGWLDCECAIIGEIIENSTVRAVAMVRDGEFIDGYSYDLAGTPCDNAVNKGFCTYPKSVRELFSDDQDLVDMKAEGYIGTPLVDSSGRPIGILCGISFKELNLPKRAEEVINILAARASAEIERKRLEKEQQELESQLQQAQKLETIGTLAGGIAHDFNNILFPVVGYTEMLIEDVPGDSPLKPRLEEIYQGALRARELVKQILMFSRQESCELMLMKLQYIVREALKLIRSTIPTTIEIKQNIRMDCGAVKADPTQIHQVIMNLATNAYHAMEDTGGELIVSLNEIELKEYGCISTDMAAGTYVCLTVADTGIGMHKELTKKIFDPFFTTKEIGKGTGMGLSVAHGIVNSMGGVIQVSSEPGNGSEFKVYFPVAKGLSHGQSSKSITTVTGGSERILLVDDEEGIVSMEKQMLKRLGYQVTTRTSSMEALDCFRADPDRFDLVITDMAMPNMPGDKLAAELVNIRPDVPIILCTGFSENISEKRAASLGIKGILMKPIVKKDLSKKIRDLFE